MTPTAGRPFPWELPDPLYLTLVAARVASALTWGWTALTTLPWNDYGWLRTAIVISKHHTAIPGWSSVADTLLASFNTVAPLFWLLNVYLFLTLALGFMTRFHGALATLWAATLAILAWTIPKTGDHIPVDFPVPIGGWFWLLGPIVVFPLVAAAPAGRRLGLDAWLRTRWIQAGGFRALLARAM